MKINSTAQPTTSYEERLPLADYNKSIPNPLLQGSTLYLRLAKLALQEDVLLILQKRVVLLPEILKSVSTVRDHLL